MLRKRGRVWYYQAQINGKKVTWSTGETCRRSAEEAARRMEKEARLLREQPVTSPKMLHEAIVAEVQRIEMDVSERQADRVRAGLTAFARWVGRNLPLAKISSAMLEDFQRTRLKKSSRETVRKEICFLIRMLRENGFQMARPTPKPGRFTPNRAFTEDELPKLFAATSPRYFPLYLAFLVTGARPAELLYSPRSKHKPLLRSEIDWNTGIVTIRSAKQRSGGDPKVRKVQVDEHTLEAIRREIEAGPKSWPFVFRPSANLPRDFDAALKRAGIEKMNVLGQKLTLHSFRHTYATFISEALGANPFLVQAALGHSQITTSARYCHVKAPQVIPIETLKIIPGTQGGVKGWCQTEKATGESGG